MDTKPLFTRAFYFVLFPLISISYILTPLTNDVMIYLGTERLVDLYYPFPQGIDALWESKPIANRIMNWVLYKVANALVGFSNQAVFSITVKLLMLLIVIAVSWYFASKVDLWYAFPLVFIALTCISNNSIGQAEYWAVILSLVCVAMLIQGKNVTAGFLFVVIVMFKGITLLLIPPIICAVYLINPDAKFECYEWANMLAGGTIGFAVVTLFYTSVFPHLFTDMLASAAIFHVGHAPLWWLAVSSVVWSFYYLPAAPLAFAALLIALFYTVRQLMAREYRNLTAFVAMWVLPFAMVVIQGEFMIYHFFVLTVPAVVSVVLWERLP